MSAKASTVSSNVNSKLLQSSSAKGATATAPVAQGTMNQLNLKNLADEAVHFPSPKDPLVFIFYDAGTKIAFDPVIKRLDKEHFPYCIIAFATAQELLKDHPRHLDVNKKLGVKTKVDRLTWPRERPLNEEDLNLLQSLIACQLVIVGTSAILEAQLAKKLKAKGIKVAAYYDVYEAPPTILLNQAFLDSVDEMIVPSELAADGFLKMKPSLKVLILGQPSLDTWAEFRAQHDMQVTTVKLGLKSNLPILLYAGGYGETYAESLKLFLEACKELKTKYQIFISLHPKVQETGEIEKRAIQEMKIQDEELRILPKTISTMEAAVVADVVVSQASTVGVQAYSLGKKVVYLDANCLKPDYGYTNIIIQKGLAEQVSNTADFLKIFAKEIVAKDKSKIESLYQEVGIKLGATNSLLTYIKTNVKLETKKHSAKNVFQFTQGLGVLNTQKSEASMSAASGKNKSLLTQFNTQKLENTQSAVIKGIKLAQFNVQELENAQSGVVRVPASSTTTAAAPK